MQSEQLIPKSAAAGAQQLVGWTAQSARGTLRRLAELANLMDRAGSALDDIAELRRAAQYIANNLGELSESAAGIDRNSAEVLRS